MATDFSRRALDQLEEPLFLSFENVGVGLFANLALELLPIVAHHILTVLFLLLLRGDPTLETLEMNEAD